MTDILKAYLTARTQLQQEKTALESRLQEINRVLDGSVAATSMVSPVPKRRGRPPKSKTAAAVTAVADAKPKKRTMSAAARAAMSAAAKARWAKRKAAGKNRL